MPKEGEPLDSSDDDFNLSSEEEEDIEDNQESDDDINPTNKQALLIDINHFTDPKKYLDTLLIQRNVNANVKTQSIRVFNSYIIPANDPYEEHIDLNGYYAWIQIRGNVNELAEIADIGMSLLSAALSEFSCEHDISRQRLTHTDRRMKSKKDFHCSHHK